MWEINDQLFLDSKHYIVVFYSNLNFNRAQNIQYIQWQNLIFLNINKGKIMFIYNIK